MQHTEGVPGGEEGTGMRRTRLSLSAVSYKQRVKKTSVFPKWEHLPLMSLRDFFFFSSHSFLFFREAGNGKRFFSNK